MVNHSGKMIRIFVIIAAFFITNMSGQSSYKINNSTWHYSKPSDYSGKIDNFEEIRQKGEKYLREEEKINFSTDDVILLSLQKSDSSTNMILATFKNNSTIGKYGLNGYAKILKDILESHAKKEYPNAQISFEIVEIFIDKVKFNIVKQTINLIEQGIVGNKFFYIAEISGKEFMIVQVNDNEIDRAKGEQSILKSTFEEKR